MINDNKILNYTKDNLKPTTEENEEITKHYEIIQEILGHKETFRSGSYARLTSTSPVNDLDVIYVLPEKYLSEINRKAILQRANESFALSQKAKIDHKDLDIKYIIPSLAEKIREKYEELGVFFLVKEQSHSVGVYFHSLLTGEPDTRKFSLDIVPAIQDGKDKDGIEMYLVPEVAQIEKKYRASFLEEKGKSDIEIEWIKSNPRAYKQQSKELREKYPDLYRLSVILIKTWKNGCKNVDEDFCLKSFHLEQIVAEEVENLKDKTMSSLLRVIFDKFPQYLEKPNFQDKANNGRFIDDYIKDIRIQQKKLVLDFVEKAKSDLTNLENSLNFEEDMKKFLNLETTLNASKTFNSSLFRPAQPRYSLYAKPSYFNYRR